MIAIPLIRLDQAIRAAGVPIDGVAGTQGSVRIDFKAAATGAQRTQAQGIADAFDWSAGADATQAAKDSKAAAQDAITNGGAQGASFERRLIFSLTQMILDEFNTHTTWNAALASAIAAATSLANLQTRVAAITAIPQRTEAQLRTAITAKINSTAE